MNFGYRERCIVSYVSLTYFQKTFLFLKYEGMLPSMPPGERVEGLSEAQAHSQNSYLKICERFVKGPRKICERSRRPIKAPALQAMGDDIASAIGCWSSGLG